MVISIVNVFAIIDAVIVRAVVLLSIAAVGAIFIIVADVVDVISSSRTTEYPDHAHLHHRLTQTIIGNENTSSMPSSVAPSSPASRIVPNKLWVGG